MKPRTYRTWPLRDLAALNESQGKVDGYNNAVYQKSHAFHVGAGGIITNVAQGETRKGMGKQSFSDEDFVEAKNLSRQLFSRWDIRKNKAVRLARKMAREGLFPGLMTGFPCHFQDLVLQGQVPRDISVIICGVDNNAARTDVTRYGLVHGLPVIHAAVARDGSGLYCFVQEPGKACWGCAFPKFINDTTAPCNLPGIIDVLQVAAGFIVFAIDTVLCGRHREWNLTTLRLDGALRPIQTMIPRNPHCPLCS